MKIPNVRGRRGRIMLHFSDYSSPRITHLIFCLSSSLFFSQSSQRNHHLPPFLFNFEFLINYVYELLIIIWRWRSKSFIFIFVSYTSTVPFFLLRGKNFSFTARSIFRIINNSIEETILGDRSNERIEDFR